MRYNHHMNDNDWIHADMTGWNVLITGGNSGIGYAYARIAVNNNANVTIACRNESCADGMHGVEWSE